MNGERETVIDSGLELLELRETIRGTSKTGNRIAEDGDKLQGIRITQGVTRETASLISVSSRPSGKG
jgi:hypothetical protein